MPQEFIVVRCFSCQMYQVHQVKKTKKWQCKMCSKKQSQIKIFGQGDGKYCRVIVQTLNLQKKDEDQNNSNTTDSDHSPDKSKLNNHVSWEVFNESNLEQSSEDSEDSFLITCDGENWAGNSFGGKKRKRATTRTISDPQSKLPTLNISSSNDNNLKVQDSAKSSDHKVSKFISNNLETNIIESANSSYLVDQDTKITHNKRHKTDITTKLQDCKTGNEVNKPRLKISEPTSNKWNIYNACNNESSESGEDLD